MPENYDIDIHEDPIRDINWQCLWEKRFEGMPLSNKVKTGIKLPGNSENGWKKMIIQKNY